MKKILKYLLLLLPFLSEAQNFAIPTVTDLATARRNVIKGNASNYVLVMYRDTLRLLGATTMFNVGYSDASSIALRQFNIIGGVGVNVSGGSGNLTADRNVTISLPQNISTSSSPTFSGVNSTGNVTISGNLTVSDTSRFNGDIIYSPTKSQKIESFSSPATYQKWRWFVDGTGATSRYVLENTWKTGVSPIRIRYPFVVYNGNISIGTGSTATPTKALEVGGEASFAYNIYLPFTAEYPLNTFLKVGADGKIFGFDLNATLDAKLNSSTAVSTYAALNSNNVFNGSNTFENPISIKTTNSITGTYSKYVLSNTDFDYTNSGLMFNLSHYEGGAVSGTNVMLLRGNKLKIGNGLDPAYTLDVAGDGNISSNFTVGGTFSMPSPFNLGGTSVTTNATRLNYLSAASGTTGTTSSNLVFSSSPTLVTPNLGTPSAATLTNATGLPISTGISGLGSGVATFLATPSSANLLAALTTNTGTGNAVFSADATLTGTTNIATIANTNGANFATSSGNVGIGGIATEKLHIFGGDIKVQNGQTIKFGDIGQANGFTIGVASGTNNAIINQVNNATLSLRTNNTDRITIFSTGNAGIGITTDAGYKLDVNGTSRATQYNLTALNTAPASATATGITGEIRVTSTHIYICTATNTWVRAALSTW